MFSTSNATNLVLDVPTRWNSTHEMLKREYELSDSIDAYIFNDKKLHLCTISTGEWIKVRDLIVLLKPLKDTTVYMSGSAYTTVSATLPTYIALLHACSSFDKFNDVNLCNHSF